MISTGPALPCDPADRVRDLREVRRGQIAGEIGKARIGEGLLARGVGAAREAVIILRVLQIPPDRPAGRGNPVKGLPHGERRWRAHYAATK